MSKKKAESNRRYKKSDIFDTFDAVTDFSSVQFADKNTNEKGPIEKEKVIEKTGEPKIANDEKKLSYKVYGQDITLTDGDVIDYYRTRMKIMVMRFMLVGRIDDKGVYRIKDEIKLDLIRMNKEISDSGEDFYRAEARYISKIFYFNIKIEMVDGNRARASLYLSEFVDDFLEDEYIVSHIADYTDVYDEQFRVKVRKAFNLFDVAIKNDEFKMPALAVLMSDEYDINEYIGGLYDIASQIYVMRMLKLLEASGDAKSQEILARYKQLIVDKDENDINEKYKYTKSKALLDRAIDEKGGLEKLDVNKDELKSIVNEVNKSVKAIDGAQKRPGAIEVMKSDKGGGGSSGGGGTPVKKKSAVKAKPSGGDRGTSNKPKKAGSASTDKGDTKQKETAKKGPVQGDASAVLSAYDAGKEIEKRGAEVIAAGKAIMDAVSRLGDREEPKNKDVPIVSKPPKETESEDTGEVENIFDTEDATDFGEEEAEASGDAQIIGKNRKSDTNIKEFEVTVDAIVNGEEIEVKVSGDLEIAQDIPKEDSVEEEKTTENSEKNNEDIENEL